MSDELLRQILSRLDQMDKDIQEMKSTVATKEDLSKVATKEDVAEIRQAVLETREDVKGIQEGMQRKNG
ncbi:hypothetical protein ACFQ40_01460 [Kroppenstedtia eburnea]|uniref:hypothetical protein n=1 Tax=Kroppenstedtia eburnea TaxID=714067 RepID=UPI00362B465F